MGSVESMRGRSAPVRRLACMIRTPVAFANVRHSNAKADAVANPTASAAPKRDTGAVPLPATAAAGVELQAAQAEGIRSGNSRPPPPEPKTKCDVTVGKLVTLPEFIELHLEVRR